MIVRMVGTAIPQTGSDEHIMPLNSSMPMRDAEIMVNKVYLALIQEEEPQLDGNPKDQTSSLPGL